MKNDMRRMLDRRSFLQTAGLAAAGLTLSPRLASGIGSFIPSTVLEHVRVRGMVRLDGKPLKGIAVSDGRTVVSTAADGSYELLTDGRHPFAFVSLPSGCEIPVSPRGSSNAFVPIAPDAHGDASALFDLNHAIHSDERHTFMLFADPQTLDGEDMKKLHETTVPDVRKTLSTMSTDHVFGVGCGDLMFDHLELFPEYERAVQATGIPFFQVLGNHDVDAIAKSDELSVATFMRTFGPTNYSFNRGAIHYVVLDDVLWLGDGYIGYLHQEQLDWLKADLSFVEKGRTVVVFVHIPVFCTTHLRNGQKRPERGHVIVNREALYELLVPYRTHVVAGHMHEIEHIKDGPAQIHVVGAVCGAWWSGPICGDGTPNGYGIFDVNGETLSWKYKSTGLDLAEQMRVYAPGADPAAPGDLLANVWDWDPEWKIVWIEDGDQRGEMKRFRGKDPLSIELHSGPNLPQKHPWVEPYVTEHLFRCTPSASAKEVTVQATDRFGRTYRSSIRMASR